MAAHLGIRSPSLDEVWQLLQNGMNRVLEFQTMAHQEHILLYTHVYNYCTSVTCGNGTMGPPPRSVAQSRRKEEPATSGAHFVGHDLYNKLGDFFRAHLGRIGETGKDLLGENLLVFYRDQWNNFVFGAKVVNHIFQYLNRYWVKREKEEGNNAIHDIYTLCLVVWRDELFNSMKSKLTNALLDQIDRERNGEAVNISLLREVINSYVNLGLQDVDPATGHQQSPLVVYKSSFEVPFIQMTKQFYARESASFLQNHSITEFMTKVEIRLGEEADRIEKYIHRESRAILIATCEHELITNHMEMYQTEFATLLSNDRAADLKRGYNLLNRITNGLEPLRAKFEEHVSERGLAAVAAVAEAAAQDPKQYADTMLAVHRKYSAMLKDAFTSDTTFVAALDKAFRKFVNTNAVTVATKSGSKSPELLARYCDSLLKKSAKNPEENELEELLNDIMVLFRYVEDKDVFQKFYSKMLAKRLVNQASASDDAEESMISKLKQACGYEYTTKLQRMFNDVGLSKDLNDRFQQHVAKSNPLNVDFNIMVLGTGSWPLNPPTTPFTIPEELERSVNRFTGFYQNQHSGRKLNWLHHHSKGEIQVSFAPNQKYTLQSSTFQMALLLQFNRNDSLTLEELKAATGINDETIKGVLGTLTKAKLLDAEDAEETDFESATKFTVNTDFKSKRIKININIPIKAEQRIEQEETDKTIEEDRKMLIQAAIVRIMKMRKVLKHNLLMNEVITQLTNRFKPKVPVIKKCIDVLIEKEYLERVEGQKDTYSYVA
eukprot:Opistho-2@22517